MSGGGPKKEKATEQEKALTQVSAAQWNDYATRFAPLNDELLERVKSTDGKRSQASGVAAADVEQAAMGRTAKGLAGANARGATTGSGAQVMDLTKAGVAKGKARGLAQAAAVQGVDDNELMAKRKMASFGRELSDDTHLSFEAGAKRAAAEQIHQMKLDADQSEFMTGMAMELGGAAIGAYKKKRDEATP